MLRAIYDIKWQQHMPNEELYTGIPRVTETIRTRRLKLSGHCLRDKGQLAGKLLLWQPNRGTSSRGRPRKTFIDTLKEDTGLDDIAEMENCMMDREVWRELSLPEEIRQK